MHQFAVWRVSNGSKADARRLAPAPARLLYVMTVNVAPGDHERHKDDAKTDVEGILGEGFSKPYIAVLRVQSGGSIVDARPEPEVDSHSANRTFEHRKRSSPPARPVPHFA
jgi:hypothetical protein